MLNVRGNLTQEPSTGAQKKKEIYLNATHLCMLCY